MNETEWLADLEAKADAATPGPWRVVTDDKPRDVCAVCAEKPMFIPFSGRNGKSNAAFIAAANPETTKRLVRMVEYLAGVLSNSTGIIEGKRFDVSSMTWLEKAYQATEPKE